MNAATLKFTEQLLQQMQNSEAQVVQGNSDPAGIGNAGLQMMQGLSELCGAIGNPAALKSILLSQVAGMNNSFLNQMNNGTNTSSIA